jgi:uridine monophosphate synthetase
MVKFLSYQERAALCRNAAAKKLFTLMEEKQTNLSVAADLVHAEELLKLADNIGPDICLLKTHIDILEDFTPEVTSELRHLAEKHQFLIFEDRKFADIGNTVFNQYVGGIYHIADWADIINAHIVPGPGIIEGLKKGGMAKNRGLLLLAEMSSAGTLAQGAYTKKAIDFADQHQDFVIGFIALRKLSPNPCFLHLTPGIQLTQGFDKLGQQYQTPETAIAAGTDIVIVGRGIYSAKDPKQEASLYKNRAWRAYTSKYANT